MALTDTQVTQLLERLRAHGSVSAAVDCHHTGLTSGDYTPIYQSIAALANMPEGGTVLLGVGPAPDFPVLGIHDPAQLELDISDGVRHKISPEPTLKFSRLSWEQQTILAIEVVAAQPTQKPVLFEGNAYLRYPTGNRRLDAHQLSAFQKTLHPDCDHFGCDAVVLPGTDISLLDRALLDELLNSFQHTNPRAAEITDENLLLQAMQLTDVEGRLRLGAVYTAGLLPEAAFPALMINASVYDRGSGPGDLKLKSRKEFGGPIPALISQTLTWLGEQLDQDEGQFALPEIAVREVLINAVLHRDLSPQCLAAGRRIEVTVLPDRLVISNPGGLRGVSLSQLASQHPPRAAANQRVYALVRNLKIADRPILPMHNDGIAAVCYAMLEAGKPDPILFDNGLEFSVALRFTDRYTAREMDWLYGLDAELSWLQKEILIGVARNQLWSKNRAVQEFYRQSPYEVRNQIQALIDQELLADDNGILALTDRVAVTPLPTMHAHELDPADHETENSWGPHSDTVIRAVNSGADTVERIIEETELTVSQVRYALKKLMEADLISQRGGQGREASYSLNSVF